MNTNVGEISNPDVDKSSKPTEGEYEMVCQVKKNYNQHTITPC